MFLLGLLAGFIIDIILTSFINSFRGNYKNKGFKESNKRRGRIRREYPKTPRPNRKPKPQEHRNKQVNTDDRKNM
jgi:hypothetical protein